VYCGLPEQNKSVLALGSSDLFTSEQYLLCAAVIALSHSFPFPKLTTYMFHLIGGHLMFHDGKLYFYILTFLTQLTFQQLFTLGGLVIRE